MGSQWAPSVTREQTIEDLGLFLNEDTPGVHRPQMLNRRLPERGSLRVE